MENSQDSKNENIERFFSYFKDKINNIDQIVDRIFRKILYFVILDTLSKCAYPKISINRERFVKFIDKFSGWHDKDRVSAYQLQLFFDRQTNLAEKVKIQIKPFISRWENGTFIRPDQEPSITDLNLEDSNYYYKKIEEFSYKFLLWKYRCFLIHEFKEPGYSMEVSNDNNSPYYFQLSRLDGSSTWELVFPSEFIKDILLECLKQLRIYCNNKGINPYDSYKFGTSWF